MPLFLRLKPYPHNPTTREDEMSDKLESEISGMSEIYLSWPTEKPDLTEDQLMARQHISYLLGVVHALTRKS